MKKVISIIMALVLCFSFASIGANAKVIESTASLQFNKDGSFKIIQIADIQDTEFQAVAVPEYIASILESEKPDLVVLTGDNISAGTGKTLTKLAAKYRVKTAIDKFMSVFEKASVPVAVVFGNHDGEGLVSKEEQMKIYESYKCCVGVDEGSEIYGCGTYNLPILSSDASKIAYNIWCFDSNMYDDVNGGYDYVHQDQVDWYVNKSNELKEANGGVAVPSMVFQHIIVNEIYKAIEENKVVSGEINENPCPGTVWGTQFSTMVNQGDVKAMFFGHDHTNTFIAKYQGIDIVNTPTGGFGSYGDDNRGVRVITLNENDTSTYSTKLINYKTTFCVDDISSVRYHLNDNNEETSSRIYNALRYIVLATEKGNKLSKTFYEILCAFA